jgi:hypothetical protein
MVKVQITLPVDKSHTYAQQSVLPAITRGCPPTVTGGHIAIHVNPSSLLAFNICCNSQVAKFQTHAFKSLLLHVTIYGLLLSGGK